MDRVVRAGESEALVDGKRETYYRINKWLNLKRKGEQEGEEIDLINFQCEYCEGRRQSRRWRGRQTREK